MMGNVAEKTRRAGKGPGDSAAAARADKQITRTVQALTAIRDQIIGLQLAPGSGFTEGELAEQLGLSKTPVREALLMLAADGLVFARPGAGYRVAPVTIRDAKALCAHRRLLESEAAARIAAMGVDSHVAMHLTELADEKSGASVDERLQRNTQFHAVIANSVQDKYLTRDLGRVILELERVLRLIARSVELPSEGGKRELLEAILAGNAHAAREAAIRHAEICEKLIIDALLSHDSLQQVNLGRPLD